jgi:hypothetical protein
MWTLVVVLLVLAAHFSLTASLPAAGNAWIGCCFHTAIHHC